jgi:MFS family permease
MLTPATIGILAASAGADRFARRHPQRWLIIAGFLATALGLISLLVLVRAHAGIWQWIPGLLLFGAGVGVMLTSSVNVVQLPGRRPGRDLWAGPQRLQSRILTRHRPGGLGPGRRQTSVR